MSQLEADFAAKVREAQEDCYDAIGGEQINLGSPKQLQVVLFDTLGMPKTKKTKTGYTTDADALTDLYTKTEHPFLEALLRHRDASRLRVTVEGLIKSVADDGRIHTTYQQTIAATGRLSSTDPNLQNIPIRTEEGRDPRGLHRGRGLRVADVRGLQPDRDAHHGAPVGRHGAHRGLPVGGGPPPLRRVAGLRRRARGRHGEMRSKVKAMSYGLAYGLSAFGLSKQLDDLDRRGAGPDGRVLRPFRRGARLPPRRGRRGTHHRLHPDDAGPPPLPARPDQRQPAAARDGRADGPQRPHPGLGRRHHRARPCCGWTPPCARQGPRRGSCSRCTTSSFWRSRRGSSRRRGLVRRRWAGHRDGRPPRGQRRRGQVLARRRPLEPRGRGP